jgi:hypothetical protein
MVKVRKKLCSFEKKNSSFEKKQKKKTNVEVWLE